MSKYDLNELRELTVQYETEDVTIPCPDCSEKSGMTIAEDNPIVSALLSRCDLCDGERVIGRARALAVLPHICKVSKERAEKKDG